MKYTTYLAITTDDGVFKLSALYYHKENKYNSPSLECTSMVLENFYWDNPYYIVKTVLPFLQKKYDDIEYKEDIKELKKFIPKEYRKDLKGIIKKGIKIGFFKED